MISIGGIKNTKRMCYNKNVHVIPVINAEDFETVEAELVIAHQFLHPSGWIHIDVVDGHFAPNITWGNPEELKKLKTIHHDFAEFKFEIHLMVFDTEFVCESWLKAGAERIISHHEVLHDPDLFLEKCEHYGAEAMVAISPETPADRLKPHFEKFRYFQVLAVKPGLAGQKFKPEILEKIRFLRREAPNAIIEVDGGITPETAKLCHDAGAHIFASASYIFRNKDPQKAYKELVSAVQ